MLFEQAGMLLSQVVSSPLESACCLSRALAIRLGNLETSQRLGEIFAKKVETGPVPLPLEVSRHERRGLHFHVTNLPV